MIEQLDRWYRGRGVSIGVAWLATVLLALVYVMLRSPSGGDWSGFLFVGLITLVFVGAPAFFGIVLMMIPVHDLLERVGRTAAALAVILVNAVFVGLLALAEVFPRIEHQNPKYRFISFAVCAAIIWLASDRLFRRSVDA